MATTPSLQAKQVAYNTFIQIFGKIVGFFISGFLLVAIAEHLGTYGMGNYVTILAFVGFFVNLADLGANLVLVREVAQNHEERERITGEFVGFRISFSLLIMLLAPLVAMLIPQYSTLIVRGSFIVAIGQFLLLLNQLFISMLQTQLQLDKGVFAELANRVVNLVIVLWAARAGYQGMPFFYIVLYATLIGAVVNTLITFFFARRLWPVRPRFQVQAWQRTLAVIAPIGLFTFISMIHFKADTIILSLIKTPIDVGIYGYAYKIGEILLTFPVMFIGVIFPKLSELLVRDKARFDKLAQLTLDVLIMGTIPFLGFIFLLAPYFTEILSRNSFSDGLAAGHALQILTIAFIAWFIGSLFIHILIMANDYKGLIRNLSVAVVINITLNLLFIPRYSYYAAATTTVITEMIMFILTLIYVRRKIQFYPKVNHFFPIFISAIVMTVTLLFLTHQPIFNLTTFAASGRLEQMLLILFAGAAGAAVYGILLWLLLGRRIPFQELLPASGE